ALHHEVLLHPVAREGGAAVDAVGPADPARRRERRPSATTALRLADLYDRAIRLARELREVLGALARAEAEAHDVGAIAEDAVAEALREAGGAVAEPAHRLGAQEDADPARARLLEHARELRQRVAWELVEDDDERSVDELGLGPLDFVDCHDEVGEEEAAQLAAVGVHAGRQSHVGPQAAAASLEKVDFAERLAE